MTTPSNPGASGGQPWPGPTATGMGSDADTKTEQVKQVAGTAADEARQAAAVAKDETVQVAGTARQEARHVVEESRQQAMHLVDEAMSQVNQQARTERDRLVGMLRTFGDDVEKMASGEQVEGGMAQDLARQLAGRARDLGGRMDGREPTELLDEVRAFARRRPGTFLLGALAAGVVAGRVTRGVKEARSQTSGATAEGTVPAQRTTPVGDPSVAAGTATGDPLAGVGRPENPVYPEGSAVGQPGSTMDQPLTQPGGIGASPGAGADPGAPGAGGTSAGGLR